MWKYAGYTDQSDGCKFVFWYIQENINKKLYAIYKRGRFISKMERAPFKCLFWKANDSIVKLTVSITGSGSLWYRPCY